MSGATVSPSSAVPIVALPAIGRERHMTLSDLVAAIDSQRQHGNLSSAIRLFVLDFYSAQHSDAEERHNDAHETMAQTARNSLW